MLTKWPRKVHKMLMLWLSQIGYIRKIHHNESVRLSKWDDRIAVTIIILSSLTAITSFTNIIDFSKSGKNAIAITVGSVSIIIGIITGISNRMKMGELSQKHQSVAAEYADLSNLIQTAAVSSEKPEPAEFMRIITDRVGIIQRFGPPLIGNDLSFADLPNYISIYNAIKNKPNSSEPDKSGLSSEIIRRQTAAEMVITERDIDIYMPDYSSAQSVPEKNMFKKNSSKSSDLEDIVIDQYVSDDSSK